MRKMLLALASVAAILLFSRGIAGPRSVYAIPANNGRYAVFNLSAPVGGVLLDTQTGRVWQVFEVTDQKGSETGKVVLAPVPFLKSLPGDVVRP